MSAADSADFVAKWLAAEPGHRLLLVFETPGRRGPRQLLESIGYELRSAALSVSDSRVVAAKLGWWLEEWRGFAAGQPRHPLTQALPAPTLAAVDAGAGVAWVTAAAALAEDVSDSDLRARAQRWCRYSQAQAQATRPWLDEGSPADSDRHALALLAERLAAAQEDLQRGRLPWPLAALAAQGLGRQQLAEGGAGVLAALADYAGELAAALSASGSAGGSRYRAAQAVLARLSADQVRRDPAPAWAGHLPAVPALRAAFAAWRASRGP